MKLNNMNKAEEILRTYIDFEDVNSSEPVTLLPLTVIDAMEEYATQCQEDMTDKKYTEEDIRKVIDETIKACNISQKESYGDLEIDTDKIINSLNKQD